MSDVLARRMVPWVVAMALVVSACSGANADEGAENVTSAPGTAATTAPLDADVELAVPESSDAPEPVAAATATPEPVAAETATPEPAATEPTPSEPEPTPPEPATPQPATPVPAEAEPTPPPEPAPPVVLVPELAGSFATIGGDSIDLGSLQGQDVVLWFWAPW